MILRDLRQTILFDPLERDVNELYIISGYATPNMLDWYIGKMQSIAMHPIKIEIIIGMTAFDGISESIHEDFSNLVRTPLPAEVSSLVCSYIYEKPAVNSNIYIWAKDGNPSFAFIGSAWFTYSAFSGIMRNEVMNECNPADAFDFYKSLISRSIYVTSSSVSEYIVLSSKHPIYDRESKITSVADAFKMAGYKTARLSLLSRTGKPGAKSGLNWGQRPGREPNQAYIPLPIRIARSGFFPLQQEHFTATTDDGHQLILRVEQQNDKAITTPERNSDLGEYFRNRLGIPNGEPVTREDLDKYGRTDVIFVDLEDGTYYMDFSSRYC